MATVAPPSLAFQGVNQPPKHLSRTNLRKRAVMVAQVRLLVLLALFSAIMLAILLRLAGIALFADPGASRSGSADYIPPRADIVDRNGEPLARTINVRTIRVVPDKILGDKQELARKLSSIFPDVSARTFFDKMNRKRPGYLMRRALPEQLNQVHALGEPGFEFPMEPERFYPQNSVASHVLGFVNRDGDGVLGMEAVLNERLTSEEGRANPATLSIDLRVQAALEDELGRSMRLLQAVGAAGVVMDVRTGELIALSSMPEYNPNDPKPAATDKEGTAIVFNKVTNQVYELGSTFKPITIASAIDAGVITDMSRRYDATKPLRIAGFTIKDSHSMGRWLNVPETLVHSSNVVTAQIADKLGREKLEATMRSLEFDRRPTTQLRERGKPLWPESWGRVTNMTVSYGHGIAVTPLHLASGYAALVNGGIWRPATLMRVPQGREVPGRRVFKASTSADLRKLLRLIVSDGTGRKADAPGFRVGGKTGSAEKPGRGGYRRNSVVATFAAAFPMDDPRYVVIAMLDEPKATAASSFQRTAGWTAAPVVARLVPRIGPLLGIVPDESRDVDVSELSPLLWVAPGDRE